jgi:phage gp36-like protein
MYLSAAQLVDRIGVDLVARLAPSEDTDFDQGRIERAIAEASAEVDSYAMQRYPTPLNPVPEMLGQVVVDLAMWRLFLWHGYDPERDVEVKLAADAARKWLHDLAGGRVSIGVSAPAKDLGAEIESQGRRFSRTTMGGF